MYGDILLGKIFISSHLVLHEIRSAGEYQQTLTTANVQVGGLERAFAISDMLAITVLIPLPFPSTCTEYKQFSQPTT